LGDNTVNAVVVDLLRLELKAKLLAHNTGEEAANGVYLPPGSLHHYGDCRAARLAQQRDYPCLLGAGAKRLWRFDLTGVLSRHVKILSCWLFYGLKATMDTTAPIDAACQSFPSNLLAKD